MLAGYYEGRIPEGEELYEDLLECICGGRVYSSSYAAAPHLVELARRAASPVQASVLLGFAADAYVRRNDPDSPPVDPLLEQDLKQLPEVALPLARKIMERLDADSLEYGWHKATICAFEGKLKEYRNLVNMMATLPPKTPVTDVSRVSPPEYPGTTGTGNTSSGLL